MVKVEMELGYGHIKVLVRNLIKKGSEERLYSEDDLLKYLMKYLTREDLETIILEDVMYPN